MSQIPKGQESDADSMPGKYNSIHFLFIIFPKVHVSEMLIWH